MDPAKLSPGAAFHGRYEIVRCIKAGGMGAVYEVVDRRTKKRRALKVMLPSIVTDDDMRNRFAQEATITAEIESEHIVETFDAGVDDESGAPFLVMELLKGEDLGAVLARRRALPADEVVALLGQAAHALDRTHAAGVVHRDLKPENLFVTRADDGAAKLKVLDFGIAKLATTAGDAKQTRTIGTPLFMAPEQIRGDGDIGRRADLFALGHIAYALLTGEGYWSEDAQSAATFALMSRMMLGISEPASVRALRRRSVQLPGGFDAFFLRAVALDPAARFESATTLVAGLIDALGAAPPRSSQIHAAAAPASDRPSNVGGTQLIAVTGPASVAPAVSASGGRTTAAVVSVAGRSAGEPRRSVLPRVVAAAAGLALFVGIGLLVLTRGDAQRSAASAAPAPAMTSAVTPTTPIAVTPVEPAPPAAPPATSEPVASSSATAAPPLRAPGAARPPKSARAADNEWPETPAPTPARPRKNVYDDGR